jgi:hypothetical protein
MERSTNVSEKDYSLEDLHALNNALAYAMSEWGSGPEGAERLHRLYERIHGALEAEQERLAPPLEAVSLAEMAARGSEPDPQELYLNSRGIHEDFANRLDLSPIRRWCGTWAVTDHGVECLAESYAIPWNRVDEEDWYQHMSEKCWVVMEDFDAALGYARTHKTKAKA